jgi:hypothetical protein
LAFRGSSPRKRHEKKDDGYNGKEAAHASDDDDYEVVFA